MFADMLFGCRGDEQTSGVAREALTFAGIFTAVYKIIGLIALIVAVYVAVRAAIDRSKTAKYVSRLLESIERDYYI